MKRKNLVFILLVLISLAGHSQLDSSYVKMNMRNSADSLVKAFREHNWPMYARYTNPALIGAIGGNESFISYISKTFAAIPDSAWKKYEVGRVLQVVKTESDIQGVIELNTVLEWMGTRVTSTYHLIAQSWDGGYFWTFFDSQNDAYAASMIKHDLSPQIKILRKVEKIEPLNPGAKGNQH